MSESPSERFNAFRQGIFEDYGNFKSKILEHYDEFLNGEWKEFEPLIEEESPYTAPKPESLPVIDINEEPAPLPLAQLPSPQFSQNSLPGLNAPIPGGELAKGGPDLSRIGLQNLQIDISKLSRLTGPKVNANSPTSLAFIKRDLEGQSNYSKALMHLPDPEFAFGELPGQIAAPNPGESGIVVIDMSSRIADEHKKRLLAGSGYATEETFRQPEEENVFRFDFYGMEAFLPEIKFEISPSVKGPGDTGEHWKKMSAQEGGVETSRQLFGLARQLGLNGYLTFRLAEQYVNQRFKNSDSNARMSAVHYLISNMGYDIRLVEFRGILTAMMPFDQEQVFGTSSLVQNNGRKYTILYPEGYEAKEGGSNTIRTCILPSNASGKTSDLRVTGLSLPFKGKSFTLSNGKLTLKGEVNENIQKMFYHYPQMPYGDFASSWIDQPLRESLVEQIRQQLAGMSHKDAINALMGLCHQGFVYKTDQAWHIFEKPYFVEENFLYDYNDCEDRAIFMSYLVWNALGIPCQLIQYPGHESVTVAVDKDVDGYYYNTDGVKYFSADPTYIGSSIGMVMPEYQSASPTIDKHYK